MQLRINGASLLKIQFMAYILCHKLVLNCLLKQRGRGIRFPTFCACKIYKILLHATVIEIEERERMGKQDKHFLTFCAYEILLRVTLLQLEF